ncbi:MAG: hypothetical protein Hals2KO_16260 [Halioglobus sp.]
MKPIAHDTHHRPGLLPLTAAAFLAALLPCTPAHATDEAAAFLESFGECRTLKNEFSRLRCYDNLQSVRDDAEMELREEAVVSREREEALQRERRLARLELLALNEDRGRLSADDPNYFVYATPVDDELDDDNHVEFYLSLKYPLVDSWFDEVQDRYKDGETFGAQFLNGITPDRFLLHYNGLFDFYTFDSDRYDSAPIISRAQNPGMSFEFDFSGGRNVLRLGWFHESNGQQLEVDNLAQFEIDQQRKGQDFALAKVSRGWDYGLIRFSSTDLFNEDPLAESWFRYQIETRFFCDCQGFGFIDGREDNIWWDENDDSRITDYDGVRTMVQQSFPFDNFSLDARLELKTGLEHSFGQYLSGRLSLGAKWENLHLTLFYFNGYGRDPSTYHLRSEYMGLGLVLK